MRKTLFFCNADAASVVSLRDCFGLVLPKLR